MKAETTGIVAPNLVPIDDNGEVVFDSVTDTARFTVDCGADGVVAAGTGTVQELPTLTVEERKKFIAATIDAVDGDVPVFAGISHPSLTVVDDLIAFAEAAGADGVFAMPPWGIPPDNATIRRYYRHIDETTELPIFLYNNPTVSVELGERLMAEITELENVVYIKESSRNWKKVAWLLDNVHEDGEVHLFTTLDICYQTIEMGGAGVTTPAPLVAKAREVIDAFHEGDHETALTAQRTLDRFPSRGMLLHAASKAAAESAGLNVGDPRPPYTGATDDQREKIDAWVRELDLPSVE